MLEKINRVILCVLLCLISNVVLATQSNILYDNKIVNSLRVVLPLNIDQASTLGEEEKQDLECLSWNLYFEARGGTQLEQIAVTWVPINRQSYTHWSTNICENVFQYNFVHGRKYFQFVWAGFNIGTNFKIETETWIKTQNIAYQVYKGELADPSNGATYFNHYSIGGRRGAIRIGSHVFYK